MIQLHLRSMRLSLATAAYVLALIAGARAHAQTGETPATKPISAGILLGLGVALGEDYNPWGIGLGVRAGYNKDRLYFGGRFVVHLGGAQTYITSGNTMDELQHNLWELGVEGGYDFRFGEQIRLRPSLVVGFVHHSVSTDDPFYGYSNSDTKLDLAPGASAEYDVNDDVFVGADLRLPFLIGGGTLFGLTFYALGGLHF